MNIVWSYGTAREEESLRVQGPYRRGCSGKVLVTVLFSCTTPLIRHDMSDSVRSGPLLLAVAAGPFARIDDGIQGRAEDVLRLPAASGGQIAVHPSVFPSVIDAVPAGG
jgi:phenylacetate-CoA ligase